MFSPLARPGALAAFVLSFVSGCSPSDDAPLEASDVVSEALPPTVRRALEEAEEVRLLSLDPYPEAFDPEAWRRRGYDRLERCEEYAVLGAVPLDDSTRRRVVRALYTGIDENDGRVSACFNPRHALSATLPGDPEPTKVEVVICFECLSLQAFVDGEHATNALTSVSPQGTFSAVLTEHAIRVPDR